MPKKKFHYKMVAYDKNGDEFGTAVLQASSFQAVLREFFGYVSIFLPNEPSNIYRIDLVSGHRHLFVCSDVCSIVNQFNAKIDLIP